MWKGIGTVINMITKTLVVLITMEYILILLMNCDKVSLLS